MIDEVELSQFRQTIWDYYHQHGRHDLPWRQTSDPYAVMVSEIMLQQTQVSRVIPKYHLFLQQFPDVEALAQAELGQILRIWSGLGYNRRAKYLQQAAQAIHSDFPRTFEGLIRLPGVGPNTAGAILVYAFDEPVVFIETNVRTVYLHYFFQDQQNVSDKEIAAIVEATLDREHPREFYWALMDYGTFLKQTLGNQNHRSRSYAKQSSFIGSRRQIRGRVLKLLSEAPMTANALADQIRDERLAEVVRDLMHEGLVHSQKRLLSL